MESCPIVLERSCCEPVATIRNIRGEEVLSELSNYLAIRKERLSLKDEVIDILENLIAVHLEDGKLYYNLLKLKRNIFNERNDKVLTDRRKIEDEILGEKILHYVDVLTSEEEANDALQRKLAEIELKTRQALKDTFQYNKDLYNGVMHVSTSIYHQLDKYLKKEAGKENCKDKKVEDVLIKLVTKAALKPSPFSTFITTRATTNYESVIEQDAAEEIHIVKSDINHVHILRIFNAILNTDEGIAKSRYEINSLVMRNSKGDFGFVKLIDQPLSRAKVFRTDNVFKTIPYQERIEKIINGMKSKKEAISFGELIALGGINSQEDGIKLVKNLLDCGVIYHEPSLGNSTSNIMEAFSKKVEKYNLTEVPLFRKISDQLIKLGELIASYNESTVVHVKVKYLNEMHVLLSKVFEICGIDPSSIKLASILYEESYGTKVKQTPMIVNEDRRNSLEVLMDLSLIFEGNILVQQLFADMFVKTYGVDQKKKMENSKIWSMLVKANSEFQYLWQNGWDIREKAEYPEEIKELFALKRKFMKYLTSEKKDVISLDKDYLEQEFLSKIPPSIRNRNISYAFFLQEGKEGVAINDQYSGYLCNLCRYFDYLPEDEKLKQYIETVFDGEEKIAENYETYGFNANVHKPIAGTRFVTGNSIDKKEDFGFQNQVALEDSYFMYDAKENKIVLYNESLGNYRPLSISSMAIFYLPGVMPALHNNSVVSMGLPDFKNIFLDRNADNVIAIPRIIIGDIVVSRKAWFVKTEWIPKQEEGFAALNQWMEENGIDKEVFVKAVYFEKTGEDLIKPQYITFMNPLFIEVFYKMIEGYECLIFEEIYPELDQSFETTKEYIFELTK